MKSKLFLFVLSYFFSFGCKLDKDLDSFTKDSPEFRGKDIFIRMACDACHSIDGSLKLGPTIKAQYGSNIRHTDGTIMQINDDYIRESLIDPLKHIVDGYTPIMPNYRPILSDEDIENIIAYIKAIK